MSNIFEVNPYLILWLEYAISDDLFKFLKEKIIKIKAIHEFYSSKEITFDVVNECVAAVEELKKDTYLPYVILNCGSCGEKYIFDKRLSQARGILRFDNCPSCPDSTIF